VEGTERCLDGVAKSTAKELSPSTTRSERNARQVDHPDLKGRVPRDHAPRNEGLAELEGQVETGSCSGALQETNQQQLKL
jgi:hypothetical protein